MKMDFDTISPAAANNRESRTKSVSFLEHVFRKPFGIKEQRQNFEHQEPVLTRQRSYSSAESPTSSRKVENDKANKNLIMKSRNISLTEALLGRRNTISVSSTRFTGEFTEEDSSSRESIASIAFEQLDAFENDPKTDSKTERFTFDVFAPNLISESSSDARNMDSNSMPSDGTATKHKPIIDTFLDHVNSYSWLPAKIPKKKFDNCKLEKVKVQRTASGVYTDDLLIDHIYKHLNKNEK